MTPAESANRASAERLGWSPGDFGAAGWGDDLEAAVREWQEARFLPVTGMVDTATVRSVVSWCNAEQAARARRKRRARKAEARARKKARTT